MDFKLTLLVRLFRLKPGDKFRLINGDGTEFLVPSKVRDSILLTATSILRDPYNLPQPTDYVELLAPTTSEIYAVWEMRFPRPMTVISCHATKIAAYKALFKYRNDEWYRQRSECIGSFWRTLAIDMPRLPRKYGVKVLKMVTGET